MGDWNWKSLCDERESMWAIVRARVMKESLCGRSELMKAMWAIGVMRESLCERLEEVV